MDEALLNNRDYTVIIAKTTADPGARDAKPKPPGFADRWIAAQAAVLTLVETCETFDPDGITVYVSCQSPHAKCIFTKYEQVKRANLAQVIKAGYPPGNINLLEVLQTALDDYFARKAAGKTKANGEMILVLLDGEPSDRMAVAKAIKAATHKMEVDEELGIGFIQIGQDLIAKGYLVALDDYLQAAGAKFDIVHTALLEAIEPEALTAFLMQVLQD
jgi:hypothetical protein